MESEAPEENIPEEFDYGKVYQNTYFNKYFNFEIDLPEDWVVQSQEQTKQLTEMGKDLAIGDNEQLEAIVNAAEINTAYLLSVFQYEVGSAVDFNPSLMILAENVMAAPGVKKGSDYLFQARKMMKQSQVPYDYLSEEFEEEVINGISFYTLEASITTVGQKVKQVYYSTIAKRFSLSVIISYGTEEQKEILLQTIQSMRLGKG